jgi:FkbM family methyltransferase
MGRLTTLGRRIYKLTTMMEQPRLWQLHRAGVRTESLLYFDRQWFKRLAIETVLDIGANTGQFARMVRAVLPNAFIYSFEPLPDCFEKLNAIMAHDGRFRAFNVGLARESGELTFHRNPYSDSSSFRAMTNLHREQFSFTAGPHEELKVPVRSLDSFADEIRTVDNMLVKIDVQGFEDEVIGGGRQILSKASAVIIEVSFAPLYENHPSFHSLYEQMRELGFEFNGTIDQLIGPLDGSILQCDALFLRPQ